MDSVEWRGEEVYEPVHPWVMVSGLMAPEWGKWLNLRIDLSGTDIFLQVSIGMGWNIRSINLASKNG